MSPAVKAGSSAWPEAYRGPGPRTLAPTPAPLPDPEAHRELQRALRQLEAEGGRTLCAGAERAAWSTDLDSTSSADVVETVVLAGLFCLGCAVLPACRRAGQLELAGTWGALLQPRPGMRRLDLADPDDLALAERAVGTLARKRASARRRRAAAAATTADEASA